MDPAPEIMCMYPSDQKTARVVVEFSEVVFADLDPVWAPCNHLFCCDIP